MSALNNQVIDEFRKLCSWAHEAWATRRTMFDDNPDIERICALGRNEAFLGRISVITQEYALLQMAKLHDPALLGNKINLTLEYIVVYGGWDSATLAKLQKLKSELDALHLQIKHARNKSLCHNDLVSLLNGVALGPFVKDADIEYFRNLQEFVSIVHEASIGGTYEFGNFAEHDARLFMEALPREEI